MPDSELKALGELAGRYADEALLSPIQGVHSAVSERVFGAIGGGSVVVKQAHDAVSSGVYGALKLGGKGAGAAISAAGRLAGGTEERSAVSDSGFGRGAQAAINGLIGDRLEEEGSPLAVKMALRLPHRDVECTRASHPGGVRSHDAAACDLRARAVRDGGGVVARDEGGSEA